MMNRRFALAVLPLFALLLTGCGATKIAEIRTQAPALDGQTVTVRGKVLEGNQLPFLAVKAYRVQDASGEIWVTTEQNLPAPGDRLVVKGKVTNVAILGSQSIGLHLKESSRASAWLP